MTDKAAVVYHITLHYEADDLLTFLQSSKYPIAKHYSAWNTNTHTLVHVLVLPHQNFALYGICQV